MAWTTSYHHFDGLGSTDRLTNAAGAVTDTYVYKAFGEQVTTTGSTTNPFRYVGEEGYYFDSDTEDYYVRARNYQPSTARWLSQDPIGYVESEWNLYGYAARKPIDFTDPSGLLAPAPPVPPAVICNPIGAAVAVGVGSGCALYYCVTKPLLEPGLTKVVCKILCKNAPPIPPKPKPPKIKKNKWKCTVTCARVDRLRPDAVCPDQPYRGPERGGQTRNAACKASEAAARNAMPVGCQVGHCKCKPQDCEKA